MTKEAIAYYDQLGAAYMGEQSEYLARYHQIRLNTARDLLAAHGPGHGILFDFACGSGEFFEIAEPMGYRLEGVDPSSVLIDLAAKRYDASLAVGGIEAFEGRKGPYSVIMALNVLPYTTEDQERRFYEHARKAASSDGVVIVSHGNALFDLVTFNRFTVEMYRDHLIPALGLLSERAGKALVDFSALLADPAFPAPSRERIKSERDFLPKRRVDPFTYADDLKQYGFEMVEMRNFNCFPLPPKLVQGTDLAMAHLESYAHVKSNTLRRLFCTQMQIALRPIK